MFSFRDERTLQLGESTDGVVTVASQLRPAAQQGAVRIEGFNETHMGVLDAAAVSARLNGLLAGIRQP